jgi:hypothetical protein
MSCPYDFRIDLNLAAVALMIFCKLPVLTGSGKFSGCAGAEGDKHPFGIPDYPIRYRMEKATGCVPVGPIYEHGSIIANLPRCRSDLNSCKSCVESAITVGRVMGNLCPGFGGNI